MRRDLLFAFTAPEFSVELTSKSSVDLIDVEFYLNDHKIPNEYFLAEYSSSSSVSSRELLIRILDIQTNQKLLQGMYDVLSKSTTSTLTNYGNIALSFLMGELFGQVTFDSELRLVKPGNNSWQISLYLFFDRTKWSYPWTFLDYCAALAEEIRQFPNYVTDFSIDLLAFFISIDFKRHKKMSVAERLADLYLITELSHDSVIQKLEGMYSNKSVAMRFDFPDAVRTPCEQYLLYFAQFLKDAGLDATADLKHDAGQVLFTVTPTDRAEALDKIREALHVYLTLPSNPSANELDFTQPGEVQQLVANIQHLKTQMMMAVSAVQMKDAALQAKDATIQTLQTTIDQLRSPNLIIDSIVTPVQPPKEKDKVTILGGAVDLTVVETKFGVNINLPHIYRGTIHLYHRYKIGELFQKVKHYLIEEQPIVEEPSTALVPFEDDKSEQA